MRDHRCKVVYLSGDDILHLFSLPEDVLESCGGADCVITRLRIKDLPEDAECDHVYYDHTRFCFGLVVYSKSFPEVPLGQEANRLELEVHPIVLTSKQSWRELPSLLSDLGTNRGKGKTL
jgi:hypothetical protein